MDENNTVGLEYKGEKTNEKHDLYFGWLCCRFERFQIINRPLCFLFCICFLVVGQGMIVTGITGTIITSLEKRYGFKSAEVALIGSSYDTAYGLLAAFIGFVCAGHKPRYLGIGAVLLAVGSFLVTFPHYLVGPYEVGLAKTTDFCQSPNDNNTSMYYEDDCRGGRSLYLTIFCIAYALLGIGAVPIYTLGPAHIDHITPRGQNGLYLGVMYACASIGPAIGFGLGKPLLNMFVDINQPLDSNLTPADSNWVGAWWIGYLIGASIFCIIIPALFALPREFPNTEAIKKQKQSLHDTVKEIESEVPNFRTFWPSTKALLTNLPYLGLTASTTCEAFAVGGLSTFSAKFLESQFGQTASTAALLTGGVIVVGATLGIFLGGYLIKALKWDCRKTINGAAVIAFVAFLFTATYLIGCNGSDIIGINAEYNNSSSEMSLRDPCNMNCNCSTAYFKPICHKRTHQTFFSPCHAGCAESSVINQMYFNCSCFPESAGSVVDGLCPIDGCNLLIPFLICELFLMFTTFMNNVPTVNATLRVVPESQGAYAMGLQQVFIRFFAFVPAPIVLGKLFDKACSAWQTDACDDDNNINCLLYDNTQVRMSVFAMASIAKLLSFLFLLLAAKTYKSPSSKHEVLVNLDSNVELEHLPDNNLTF